MVSVIPTTQDAYKGYWSSLDEQPFMDQSKPERPLSRYPSYSAPLTDPGSSLQSLLPSTFSVPPQTPLELKLPEGKASRKRKASDVEDLGMSQQHFQRPRRDDGTIDPQSLTTPFAATSYSSDYSPMPATTSSYANWQPPHPVRTASASGDAQPNQFPYGYLESSPVPSSYSHRSSIASTGSQSMGPVYANATPFQPSYGNLPYPPHAYAPPPPPPQSSEYASANYSPSPYASSGYPPVTYGQSSYSSYMLPQSGPVPPPITLESSRVPRPRTQSYPQAAPSSSLQPSRTFPNPPAPPEAPRPKPQCWEHGCNGREFSTFSNLLRHQRERRGTAPRSVCPRCGAEFTRSTARTNHLLNSKCKPRRGSS